MVKRFNVQTPLFIPDAGTKVQFVHHAFRISWRGCGLLSEPLPQQFREGLDDLFFSRSEKKGEILTPKAKKDKDPTAQPASKNPDKPKPN